MVFYIEACESGSMMNHLPDNINGEQSVNSLDLNATACHRQDLSRYYVKDRFKALLCTVLIGKHKNYRKQCFPFLRSSF